RGHQHTGRRNRSVTIQPSAYQNHNVESCDEKKHSMNTNVSIGTFALFFGFTGTVLMAEEKPEAQTEQCPGQSRKQTHLESRTWLRRRRFSLGFFPDLCRAFPERLGLCLVAHRFVNLGKVV